MNDLFGVRSFTRCYDLRGEPQGLRRSKSLWVFTGNNRRSVNVLHDYIIRADIVNLADVGMIQRGDGFGFTFQSVAELRTGNFDCDVPIQTRVSGAIHFSHTSRANGSEDFVRARFIAGRKLHMTGEVKSSPSPSGWGT